METTGSGQEAVQEVDLLVLGASELVTATGKGARGGAELGRVTVLDQGAIACDGGKVVAIGTQEELASRFSARRTIDAAGGLVVPGLIDSHTHPVFHGTREHEFELRASGASYLEIARAGGGILHSVNGVREASSEVLLAALLVRLDRFLELGTTTIEAKSGYGLSLADELKCLEVLARAQELHPVRIVPTFLGAHTYPPEYEGREEKYVDLVVEEMLPAVAERGLARFCDVFTESVAFDVPASRRILERARDLGLGLRLHVDQLSDGGGAELAARLGAASADHLEHVSEAGIAAMAEAGTVPVLCPVVPLFLREAGPEAPARKLVEAGLGPALATDYNPGSCYMQSLVEVLSWGALRYGMTAGEALTCATQNAAVSLGLGHEIGTLEPDKRADLLVLDLPNHGHLTYELGRSPVQHVVIGGELVWSRGPGPRDLPG